MTDEVVKDDGAAAAGDGKGGAAAAGDAKGATAGAAAGVAGADKAAGDKGAADGTMLGKGGAGDDEAAAGPQTWPDDWRERIAGKDEKSMARLKRFASPENLYRSFAEADAKIRSGQYKMTLGEEASPEEVAEYRKAHGVPEAVDGYEFDLPGEPSEADAAVLNHFKAEFHKNHVPAGMAKQLVSTYFAHVAEVSAAQAAVARETTINNRAQLRSSWGADFKANSELGDNLLIAIMGEADAPKLPGLVLKDGTRLGDNPLFANFVAQAARAQGDAEMISIADFAGTGGGGSLDEQYNALIQMSQTNPVEYAKPENQAKVVKLAAARNKRDGIAA